MRVGRHPTARTRPLTSGSENSISYGFRPRRHQLVALAEARGYRMLSRSGLTYGYSWVGAERAPSPGIDHGMINLNPPGAGAALPGRLRQRAPGGPVGALRVMAGHGPGTVGQPRGGAVHRIEIAVGGGGVDHPVGAHDRRHQGNRATQGAGPGLELSGRMA